MMRQCVGASSRWFANKNNGHSLTADDLRQLLDPDSEDYNPLLNNIFLERSERKVSTLLLLLLLKKTMV